MGFDRDDSVFNEYWNPSPPDWRFRYLTYLKPEELKRILADVTAHYGIRLYQDTAVYQKGFAGA